MLLFSGSSHPLLAKEIAAYLGSQITPMVSDRFPDGEIFVRILESVRGHEVFVVQTIAKQPNEYLIELLIMLDALKRASARSVTVVIPYFGYCRQDRKDKPREPITAKLVADLLTKAGANHILTVDLHAGQLEGFFDIPVDNIHGMPLLAQVVKEELELEKNCVVVAPDVGSIKLAQSYANFLGSELAIVGKRRLSATAVQTLTVIGDVEGKDILLADDMCSTGDTLESAAKACQEKGAKRIFAVVTHGLLVGDAIKNLEKGPIEALYMSNTIPYTERAEGPKTSKIKVQSIANPLGEAIRCIRNCKTLN